MSNNGHSFNGGSNNRRDNRGFGDRRPNGGGFHRAPRPGFDRRPSFGPKPRTYLNGDFSRDMKALRILGLIRNPQTRRDEHKDETPQFIAYLTLALQNISEILGKNKDGNNVDISAVGEVDRKTGEKGPDTIGRILDESGKTYEVASFLWLHRMDNPGRDFPDYAERTKAIVVKLWELRNMFVHSTQDRAAKVLIVEPQFARFIEDELFNAARRENALGSGRKTEKVFKLRLFCPNNDGKTKYEFTRRGIIFLVCLALYRHDASEFIQQFPDMQLPPREWEMEQGFAPQMSEEELVALRKKGGSVKAIIDAFTYFSMRSSRTDIDVANSNYLNFANILLYLNKVPSAAYPYLSLDAEAKRLVDAAGGSNESEENRRFKYVLQERKKDRFLTLALAYIEDFHKLDCIKFKRLDVSAIEGRSRYLFGPIAEGARNEKGEEIQDANGMDRHYVVGGGIAQFEFKPKDHGDRAVKITSLRGSIGENEIMRLLLVMHDGAIRRGDPNKVLEDYLAAYHRILERMLNARDTSELTLEDAQFREDFNIVRGKDGKAEFLTETFVEDMQPFFPPAITRFFVGDDLRPDTDQLQAKLRKRLSALSGRAGDFLLKMDRLTEWKELDDEERERRGKPTFAIGELRFPPRTCKFTDAQLIQWVLRYLNVYLSPADKFRQLPRGMRHRGVKDFEFQLLHADIGKFGTNPDGLWRTLEKRDSLNAPGGALEVLKNNERDLFLEEQRRCRGKTDKNGRPLRPGHTLTMLAYAAAELYADVCDSTAETYCGALSESKARMLPGICRLFGVRTGQPLDRASLVKSILGIDLASWGKAYDYEAQSPRETPRSLERAEKLIAPQIPVPNDIARRCVKTETKEGEPRPVSFNPAFRAFDPWGKGNMKLRSFYDVSPLVSLTRRHAEEQGGAHAASKKGHLWANADLFQYAGDGIERRILPETAGKLENGADLPMEPGKNPPRHRPSFLRGDVNKAIQAIQLAERQDKVLLACAREYWDKYMGAEVQTTEKKAKIAQHFKFSDATDIWEFFRMSMDDVVDGVTVRMMPNDFARPAYGTVLAHLKELVPLAKPLPGTQGVYAFYDLWLSLRDLQRKESSLRLEFLPAMAKFNVLVNAPDNLPGGLDELFAFCQKKLRGIGNPPLAREEFDAILELDKRLRHPAKDGVSLSTMEKDQLPLARAALRRFGCLKVKK